MGENKYLFDCPALVPHFFKETLYQIADNEQDVAIQAGDRIIEDDHTVWRHATLWLAAFK